MRTIRQNADNTAAVLSAFCRIYLTPGPRDAPPARGEGRPRREPDKAFILNTAAIATGYEKREGYHPAGVGA